MQWAPIRACRLWCWQENTGHSESSAESYIKRIKCVFEWKRHQREEDENIRTLRLQGDIHTCLKHVCVEKLLIAALSAIPPGLIT